MSRSNLYSRVAAAWGCVFLVVGLFFLFSSELTAEFILAAGGFLGLHGEMQTPFGSLWHVLSVSLMSMVTVAAFFSARYPEEKGVYLSLMTAKVVSSFLFLVLFFTQGQVWLLCFFADGFVALTLFVARRYSHDTAS